MKRVICMVLFMGACASRTLAPTAPTASTASTPSIPGFGPQVVSGPYTISGTVTDGNRAVAGANVSAWVQSDRFGYSYMWAHGANLTDGSGRFQLPGLPAGVTVRVQLWKADYVQQCAAPVVVVTGDTTVDLTLFPKTTVSASAASLPTPAAGSSILSGTVFEIVDGVKRPVDGAFVDYEPVMDFPAALTYTNVDGRFALCGIPVNELGAVIGVASKNRVTWAIPSADANANVEITFP